MLLHFSKTKTSDWKDKESLSRLRTIVEIYKATFENSNPAMIQRLQHLTTFIDPINPSTKSSQLHLDLMKHLEKLLNEKGWSSEMKKEYPFWGFSLDIAFPNERLAIEIDGPYHFDENEAYMPKNILKETLLEIKGWKLERIKHSDWPRMLDGRWNGFDQEKRDFLLSKFEQYLSPCEIVYFEDQDDELEDESNDDYDPMSEKFFVAEEQIIRDLEKNRKQL